MKATIIIVLLVAISHTAATGAHHKVLHRSKQYVEKVDCSGVTPESVAASMIEKYEAASGGGAVRAFIDEFKSLVETCIAPREIIVTGEYSWEYKFNWDSAPSESCPAVHETVKAFMRQYTLNDVENRGTGVSDYTTGIFDIRYGTIKSKGFKSPDDWINFWDRYEKQCEKAGQDPFGPYLTDMEYEEYKANLKNGNPECLEWRTWSSDQGTDYLRAIMADSNGNAAKRATDVMAFLECLLPWEEYSPHRGKEWIKAKRPTSDANCELWSEIIDKIAMNHIVDDITSFQDAPSVFRLAMRTAGIELIGSDLIEISHQLAACNLERPYRDWGTTNRDTASPQINIKMSMDADIPDEVNGNNAMRVQLFCLSGVVVRDGNLYLRPGQSTTWSVARSKWEKEQGLMCTLNQGLDAIRTYEHEGHRYTCVDKGFYFKKFGSQSHHFQTPEYENCPFQWVEAEDSTQRNPHIKMALRKWKALDEDEDVCDKYKDVQDPETGVEVLNSIFGNLKKGKEARAAEANAFFECLVPRVVIANGQGYKADSERADCGLFGAIVNTWAQPWQHESVVSMMNGLSIMNFIAEREHGVEWRGDDLVQLLSYWEACSTPRAYVDWGWSWKYGEGDVIKLKISVDSAVGNVTRSVKVEPHCFSGLVLENDLKLSMSYNKYPRKDPFIPVGRSQTYHLQADEESPLTGLQCDGAYFHAGECNTSWRIKKLGQTLPHSFTVSDLSTSSSKCKYHFVEAEDSTQEHIHIRLEPMN